jgi:geranylgeranyl reductase family protein
MTGEVARWGREDSNLRRLSRRVYSPFPLAARAHPLEAPHCSLQIVKRYDVVVIGGGPAGSTTAYRLAEQGAKVLLVDKATFPRDKPCGGGLTLRAVRQCPIDPTPVVEEWVDRVELRFRYRTAVVRSARAPVVWMTQRRRLDAFLLDAAREKSVEVREGVHVSVEPGGVVSIGSSERVAADVIVGADGANGITAKSFGLGNGIVYGVAYEGNVGYDLLDRDRYARRLVLELADIPGGYAWVFPKGDHANIGVGGWQSEGPKLKQHLRRACEAHGLTVESLSELRGHRLPLRRPGTQIAAERCLLVGDAAGLIDPVSGDGMYECFVSSRLAAAAIFDLLAGRASGLAAYEAAVEAELSPLHRASWKLKRALDRWPWATWQVARTRLLWVSIRGMIEGELADPDDQHGLARVPLRALAILGRGPA